MYISFQGLKKLKEELQQRSTTKRQEIAKQLEEAKQLGDLSENAEYAAAKEAQAANEARILQLEETIKKATLITPKAGNKGTVQVGATVEVEPVDGGPNKKTAARQKLMIVGSQEADPLEGKISNESPLGRAFLGHKTGDLVDVETPRGRIRYKIVKIK